GAERVRDPDRSAFARHPRGQPSPLALPLLFCTLSVGSQQPAWAGGAAVTGATLALESRTPPAPAPSPPAQRSRRYQSIGYRAKRVLLGPPLTTSQLIEERISKRVALAVFSSDPISSTAYATEEILLVLVFAGSAAVGLALPISIAIAGLLGILVLSYREIINSYRFS